MSEKKEYIERGALLKAFGCENAVKYGNKNAEQQHKSYSSMMLYEIADEIYDAPAADVEPVGIRTTFDEEAAQAINNFIDLCEVDSESMDGFVQDRFKTYLRALVYESIPAHMERSGSGE